MLIHTELVIKSNQSRLFGRKKTHTHTHTDDELRDACCGFWSFSLWSRFISGVQVAVGCRSPVGLLFILGL